MALVVMVPSGSNAGVSPHQCQLTELEDAQN
jgi:hypothetical protein